MEAAPPGQELVSCFRGNIEDAVDTGLFQCIRIRLWIAAEHASSAVAVFKFSAAEADKSKLNLSLKPGVLLTSSIENVPPLKSPMYANLSRLPIVIIFVSIPPMESPAIARWSRSERVRKLASI